MPYIPSEEYIPSQNDRAELDPLLDAVQEKIKELHKKYGYPGAFAGLVNYACTRISLGSLPVIRYWTLAILEGIFGHLAKEFYRRIVALYEDKVIGKNGDVKEYVDIINHINQKYVRYYPKKKKK